MKRNHTEETDSLERLFAAARREQVANGEDFSRRVLSRLEPLPPSKNLYRIPTFATALASVLLWGALILSGFDFNSLSDWVERWGSIDWRADETTFGVRWLPTTWTSPDRADHRSIIAPKGY